MPLDMLPVVAPSCCRLLHHQDRTRWLFIMDHGLVIVRIRSQGTAKVVMDVCIVGTDFQGLQIMSDGFADLTSI